MTNHGPTFDTSAALRDAVAGGVDSWRPGSSARVRSVGMPHQPVYLTGCRA